MEDSRTFTTLWIIVSMYDKTNIMQIESRERKNVNRSSVFDILRALELLSV